MNLTKLIILAGLGSTLLTLAIILIRHRGIEDKRYSAKLGRFLFGANLPPSVFLCIYAFNPDEAISKTRLAGYEWYFFFAGMAAFLFGLDGLLNVLKQANK